MVLFAGRSSAQKLPFKPKSSAGAIGPKNRAELQKIRKKQTGSPINDMIYLIFEAEFFVKSNCLHKIKIFFFTLLKSEIQVLNMNPNQNDFNCFDLTNYRNLLTFGTHWWLSINLSTINENIETTDLRDNKKSDFFTSEK